MIRPLSLSLLMFALAVSAPCARAETRPDADALEGAASWYGPGFHGRITANGETFDQNALTAAHRTLPLPTLARVTRLDTGRSVTVRINDRGPYVDGRVIDLSKAAAQALGFTEDGVADVRIEPLGPANPADRAAAPVFFTPGGRPGEGPPRGSAARAAQGCEQPPRPALDGGARCGFE